MTLLGICRVVYNMAGSHGNATPLHVTLCGFLRGPNPVQQYLLIVSKWSKMGAEKTFGKPFFTSSVIDLGSNRGVNNPSIHLTSVTFKLVARDLYDMGRGGYTLCYGCRKYESSMLI